MEEERIGTADKALVLIVMDGTTHLAYQKAAQIYNYNKCQFWEIPISNQIITKTNVFSVVSHLSLTLFSLFQFCSVLVFYKIALWGKCKKMYILFLYGVYINNKI